MVVACMTTSVALVHTLSKYMQDTFKVTYKLALLVSILVCFIISCFGIDAITNASQPVLMCLYPILILISVLSVFR